MALAVALTAVALGLINLGVAVLIVAAMGAPTFAPLWLGILSLALGLLAAGIAFRLWRAYASG
jgi:hypothetical protein